MRWQIAMLVMCVMLIGVTLSAQAQSTKPAKPAEKKAGAAPEVSTMVYNVSDLVRATEDYPLEPAMIPSTSLPGAEPRGGGGGGFVPGPAPGGPMGRGPEGAAQPAQAAPTTVDAIGELIRETVDPESWTDQGGTVGRMRAFGRSLIITQTGDNHGKIQSLLNQLHQDAAPNQMIAVRAYWVLLKPNDILSLGEQAKQQKKSAAMLEVPDSMFSADTIYSQGQTLCFNGQTVHISSGRGHTIITGATPVVGSSSVGYQFDTAVVQNGVALQVKPEVTADGKSAVLDLQSIVSELPETKELGADAKAAATTQVSDISSDIALSKIDRVNVVAQQFRTTVRVPLDKKVLIGGMTMEPNNAANSSRNLYLVVEVSAGD